VGVSRRLLRKNTNKVRNFFDEKWGETRELKKIRKKEENEERREIER